MMETHEHPVYLDHNATTSIHPDVLEAMLPYLRGNFGNASSIHLYGRRAHKAMEQARAEVAALSPVSRRKCSSLRVGPSPTLLRSVVRWRRLRIAGTL